jgi:hypothetical protein
MADVQVDYDAVEAAAKAIRDAVANAPDNVPSAPSEKVVGHARLAGALDDLEIRWRHRLRSDRTVTFDLATSFEAAVTTYEKTDGAVARSADNPR